MEKTYISWNIVNWVTVVLMSTIGVAAVGFGASLMRGTSDKSSAK